jgi:hypothetical protein
MQFDPTLVSDEFPHRLRRAFALLHLARDYARSTSSPAGDFALEVSELRRQGLNTNDFRWLIRRGFVEHWRETTRPHDSGRSFLPSGNLAFSDQSCFTLTDAGVAAAEESLGGTSRLALLTGSVATIPASDGQGSPAARQSPERLRTGATPRWNSEVRELLVGNTLVKCFRYAAINQETVLSAFEEEGWPSRIDDPLPPEPEQDPKRRLNDTIKCLNRKQANRLLHFRGDGTGQRVVWEYV